MRAFFTLLLSFAPWLCFLILARGSLFNLKVALVISLAVSVVMGVTGLHRGTILWVGLAFFTSATIAVLGFENMWMARHMGILANGALAAGAWSSLVVGHPFTLDYARRHVDLAFWHDKTFVRSNQFITALWASVFTVNTVLSYGKVQGVALTPEQYELLSYALLIGAAAFSSWYPAHIRRQRDMAAKP